MKICPQCGNEFTPWRNRRTQIYCTPICTSRARGQRTEYRKYMEGYRAVNRERMRRQERKVILMKKFGLSIEQYEQMLESQNNVCAICEKPDTDRSLAVDHCHATGKNRQLLCKRCNHVLGKVKDDPTLLLKMAAYLERHVLARVTA